MLSTAQKVRCRTTFGRHIVEFSLVKGKFVISHCDKVLSKMRTLAVVSNSFTLHWVTLALASSRFDRGAGDISHAVRDAHQVSFLFVQMKSSLGFCCRIVDGIRFNVVVDYMRYRRRHLRDSCEVNLSFHPLIIYLWMIKPVIAMAKLEINCILAFFVQ